MVTTGITVNGSSNTLSGTVTGAITQNSGSGLTVSGTAGSDALNTGATLTGSGAGSVTTVTLAGSNTITGPLTTTGITVNNGSNTIAGAVTGAITQNSGSSLTVSGTAGSDALNTGATLTGSGSGSVGAVTLAGTDTLSGPLTAASISVNGSNNSITSGTVTVTGATTINGTLTVASGATDNGAVSVATGGTFSGYGTVGGLTLANNANINLQDGLFGTLTASSLSVPTGAGNLSIDVGSTPAQTDELKITNAANLGANSIVVNVDGTVTLTTGNTYTYTIAQAGSGLLPSDFTKGTLSGTLLGDTVAFSQGANDSIIMTVTAQNGYYYTGGGVYIHLQQYRQLRPNARQLAGTQPASPLGPSSAVFFTANSPANVNAALNASVEIGSLEFNTAGSGATISARAPGDVLTVDNGITVDAGVRRPSRRWWRWARIRPRRYRWVPAARW